MATLFSSRKMCQIFPQMSNHSKKPAVLIIVVFHNGQTQTIRCLESIKSLRYPSFSVTVVDDGSTDGSSETIGKLFPDVEILKADGTLWCNGSFNLAMRDCLQKGFELFLLLNNDNVIEPEALNYLVETHLSRNAPIVGSLVGCLHQPDTVSYAGKRIDWKRGCNISVYNAMKINDITPEVLEVDFLGFQGVLISKCVFESIGLFDSKIFKHYCGDADFYLRAGKAGFKTLVDTRSVVWDDVNTKGPTGPSPSLIEFIGNLASVKSIAHLPTRYRFYKRHAPVFWLKPFGKYYLELLRGQLAVMVKHHLIRLEGNNGPVRKSLAKLFSKATV